MHKFSATSPKSLILTVLRSVGLLNVLKSTFAVAWGTRLRVTRLVRPALAPLRYENLCIMRAREVVRVRSPQILPFYSCGDLGSNERIIYRVENNHVCQ